MARVRPGGRRGRSPSAGPEGRWIVALPAWGERCVGLLLNYTLPALVAAVRALPSPVELLIWTDQTDRVKDALLTPELNFGATVDVFDVPGPDNAFESMSTCHRAALAHAGPRDRVVLLTADMVVSREVLATAAAYCARGTQLVCCVAMRTLETAGPPVGAAGRELLAWGWANRHPMTQECTWPEGRSYDVWRTYYERGEEVVARVFLPHPLVVVPGGRRLDFRPTIDVNLAANFSRSVTYLITDPNEGAVVELSPADKEFLLTTTMRERMDAGGPSIPPFVGGVHHRHRMFFEKKVVIRGVGGDVGDEEVVRRFLG